MTPMFAVCLQELLATNAISHEQLTKAAEVSADDARRSLDRLDSLERVKPTAGQFGRYTGIGGAAGAAAGAIGNAIEHGSALKGGSTKAKLLNVAANTAKGALAGGAVPLLRNHMDRRAEMGTLHNFMSENKVASAAWVGLFDRMRKEAAIVPRLMSAARALPGAAKTIATGATEAGMHKNEIAGLGVLAVPGLDTLQATARARFAGDKGHDAVEKRHLLGEGAHAALDVGGLGMLAAPAVAHLKHAFAQSGYSGNVAQNPPGMRGHSGLAPFNAPELETKKAGVEELLTKKMRAEGKSAEEADRLIGEGKTAGALKGLAKDPMRQASGILRTGEKLLGTRAKRLDKHLGGLKQDLGTAKGLRDLHAKDQMQAADIPFGKANKMGVHDRNVADLEGKKQTTTKALEDEHAAAKLTRIKAGIVGTYGLVAGAAMHKANTRSDNAARKKKEAGAGVGAGMSTSQYSGPLSLGSFKMVSGAPAYSEPALEQKKASAFFAELNVLMKSAGGMNTATDAMHAAGRLHTTQSVGAPKTTAPAGPSIADIAKPKGFGTPLAGAKKTTL